MVFQILLVGIQLLLMALGTVLFFQLRSLVNDQDNQQKRLTTVSENLIRVTERIRDIARVEEHLEQFTERWQTLGDAKWQQVVELDKRVTILEKTHKARS